LEVLGPDDVRPLAFFGYGFAMDERNAAGTIIRRWVEIADRARLLPELDAIFFEASATKSFANEAERAAFRERWLGRYLSHYPDEAFVALTPDGTVAGYLVGSLDDPASTPLFSDIAYFADLARLTARYPAQLHVNLAQPWRGGGIGSRLVAAFADHARRAGAPGVHAVTGRAMRNVGFYLSNGFDEAGAVKTRDRELVFLARSLVD
jgi:GNAT superfamily N-acetyltransferase